MAFSKTSFVDARFLLSETISSSGAIHRKQNVLFFSKQSCNRGYQKHPLLAGNQRNEGVSCLPIRSQLLCGIILASNLPVDSVRDLYHSMSIAAGRPTRSTNRVLRGGL